MFCGHYRRALLCCFCTVAIAGQACATARADDANFDRLITPLASSTAPATPKFELDLSDVPDDAHARRWGQAAQALCEAWFPVLCRHLATDDWKPPATVRLVMKKQQEAPGATSGGEISISTPWITAHADDFGMVIHELTHVIQDYPPGSGPGWLVEGIADYVRYWKYEPERPRGPVGKQASYRDGYGTTGAFLAWISVHYDRRLVTRLDGALRHQRYNDALFEEMTGKKLDTLWQEFIANQGR